MAKRKRKIVPSVQLPFEGLGSLVVTEENTSTDDKYLNILQKQERRKEKQKQREEQQKKNILPLPLGKKKRKKLGSVLSFLMERLNMNRQEPETNPQPVAKMEEPATQNNGNRELNNPDKEIQKQKTSFAIGQQVALSLLSKHPNFAKKKEE